MHLPNYNSGQVYGSFRERRCLLRQRRLLNRKNTSADATNFYLSTDIINSLEDKSADGSASSATGGAYSYKVSYTVDGKETIIFDSDVLGGESTVKGLNQVKSNLAEGKEAFFPLGTLNNGGAGTVTIQINLDGNSQDNAYMYKLATLDVKFGVEKAEQPQDKVINNTVTRNEVYTIPGGQQVIAIDEPTTPLAGGSPQTGDSIVPLVGCTAGLLVGMVLIGWYFIISKKGRKEVA